MCIVIKIIVLITGTNIVIEMAAAKGHGHRLAGTGFFVNIKLHRENYAN